MQAFQDIFISYGRKDSLDFAAQLNHRLLDRGFMVWFDFDDIPVGVDYQKQIDDGIERSDNFIFIISPHSINSPYCLKEIELALKWNKRIIPLMHVETISLETWQARNPDGTMAQWQEYKDRGLHDHFQNMHPEIRKINWIYFREGVDDFEQSFVKLLGIFEQHSTYVHQHTTLLIKALEWEQNQHRSRYLLVGEERLQAEAWLKTHFTDSQPPCRPTDLHCELITESLKNAENLMSQVFLAYAEEEQEVAQKLRSRLMREGITVWMNTRDIGTGIDFRNAIDRGLEEADNLIYLISPAAVQSEYCQHELDYARLLSKRIIPILAHPIDPQQLPTALRNLQYIDLTDNLLETDQQQDENQLLRVLRDNAAYHSEHKVLLAKALKWQRQQQNPTFLLRGYNLRSTEAWLKLANQSPQYPPIALQTEFIAASLQQPPGLSLDVFISYSRVDSGVARQLNDRLQIQGKRTWFDQESIAAGTADFQAEIHRGIESADHFLFILSPNSIDSPYCSDEVEYAAKLNKRVVTILHRPIDINQLHPELAKVQWLDCSQPDGDDSANFQSLLRILDTDVEHLQVHTKILLRSIEWNDKGRTESLLLRSEELENAEHWLTQSTGKDPKPTELQQTYITNSRSVETAHQQATQILQAAALKGKQLIRLGAAAGTIGLLVAGISGWFALKTQTDIKVANLGLKTTKSSQQLMSQQPFAALLTALQAGQDLQQFKNSHLWDTLQPDVALVLQESTHQVSEINTLTGHQDNVQSVSFSPDGKTIASASKDNKIRLWDAETGAEKQILKGHKQWVNSVSFSPDGKAIASASNDNTVKLWDATSGKLKQTLNGHQDWVNSVSFSPDGKTIASASNDNTIKLWDATSGKLKQTLTGHQYQVNSVSFSPDGKRLVSGAAGNTVKIWTIATGKADQTLTGRDPGQVFSAKFSPNGQTIAIATPAHSIELWDVATGKRQQTLMGHPETIYSLSFSPDGQTIAATSEDKTIRLWTIASGQVQQTFRGHQGPVESLSFSPDGKRLVSGSTDNTLKLWQVGLDPATQPLSGHQNAINSVSFSPDGETIASASDDKTIKLWNVTSGNPIQTLSGHQAGVMEMSFSPDGETIASASLDQTIKLWDVTSGGLLQTLRGHQSDVRSVSFSPDGQTLVSASEDRTIRLWDVTSGQMMQTLSGHQDGVISVSFSPDGRTIVSTSMDKTIRLWDVASGQIKQTFKGEQDWFCSVRFSPDGQTITAAGHDKTIKFWDVATGNAKQVFSGHQGRVASVNFSPDGQMITSSGADKTIRLWDVATGKTKQVFSGHQDLVESVNFSPDGQTIVSASGDRTIRVWLLDLDRLMTRGCQHLETYLKTRPDQHHLCTGYLPETQ